MSPVIIDIDSWLGLLQSAGALVVEILTTIQITVNNHQYTAFVAFLGILIFSILLYHFWGDDD